jgi:hypothetical protein
MLTTNFAKTVRSVANNALAASCGDIYNDKLTTGARSLKIQLYSGAQFDYSPIIAELQRLGYTVQVQRAFKYACNRYTPRSFMEVVRLHITE